MRRFVTPLFLLIALFAVGAATNARALVGELARDAGDVGAVPEGVSPFATAPQSAQATGTIYENTSSPVLFAFSSTDLTSIWGDQLTASGTGILSMAKFTVFNSGSSAGVLSTAAVQVQIYDSVTSAYLGGFTTNVNFGGLAPGFFSTVTVNSLDALNISLTTPNLLVLQRLTSITGAATRLGFVSLNPPTVGSSPDSFYASSATVGGGAAGFYTSSSGPANPGYQLYVVDFPVPTQSSTWGRLKSLY